MSNDLYRIAVDVHQNPWRCYAFLDTCQYIYMCVCAYYFVFSDIDGHSGCSYPWYLWELGIVFCSPIRTHLYCMHLWICFVPLSALTFSPRRQVIFFVLFSFNSSSFLFFFWFYILYLRTSIHVWHWKLFPSCRYQEKWCYKCIIFCMPCQEMTETVISIIGMDCFKLITWVNLCVLDLIIIMKLAMILLCLHYNSLEPLRIFSFHVVENSLYSNSERDKIYIQVFL